MFKRLRSVSLLGFALAAVAVLLICCSKVDPLTLNCGDGTACSGNSPYCGANNNVGPKTCKPCGAAPTDFCSQVNIATPVCNVSNGSCGGCTSSSDCSSLPATPVCDIASMACVPCTSDSGGCTSGATGGDTCATFAGGIYNYCGYSLKANITALSGSALTLLVTGAASLSFSIPIATTSYSFPLSQTTLASLPNGTIIPKETNLGTLTGNLLLPSGTYTATINPQPTGQTCAVTPSGFDIGSAAPILSITCCTSPLTPCRAGCVDLTSSPTNCGACNNICSTDKSVCLNSLCVSTPTLSYSGSPYTETQRTAITTITPALSAGTGATISNCTVSPALPTGLSLSTSTCAISGTPTLASPTTSYTITVTNSFSRTAAAIISMTVSGTSCATNVANSCLGQNCDNGTCSTACVSGDSCSAGTIKNGVCNSDNATCNCDVRAVGSCTVVGEICSNNRTCSGTCTANAPCSDGSIANGTCNAGGTACVASGGGCSPACSGGTPICVVSTCIACSCNNGAGSCGPAECPGSAPTCDVLAGTCGP